MSFILQRIGYFSSTFFAPTQFCNDQTGGFGKINVHMLYIIVVLYTDLLDTSPKVSSHFFDVCQKEHCSFTISFCYGKDICSCKKTGMQRWDMLLQTIPQPFINKRYLSLKLKLKQVRDAKVSSNVSERQLFKGKLTK
jgi:hypothetical protein